MPSGRLVAPPAAGAAPAGSAPSLAQLTSRFGCPIFCSAAMLAPWVVRVEGPRPVSVGPGKLVPRDASRAAFSLSVYSLEGVDGVPSLALWEVTRCGR